MIEKAEKQQTLADFLLLAQNVEKELASAVQSIDMVQDEKKPLLKTYLKSEPLEADPLEERLSDEGQAEELVRLNMDSHTHSVSFSDNSIQCVLKYGFTRTFSRNQDVTVKLKPELIFKIF